jgi:hypothetical protein
MPADRSYVAYNDASRARLHQLIARLSDADLQRPCGLDWTIAGLLAHLTFWERRALVLVQEWSRGGHRPSPIDPDIVNHAAMPQWLALPPRVAAQQALEAVAAIDREFAALTDEMITVMRASQWPITPEREHRVEHLGEIERAVGRTG